MILFTKTRILLFVFFINLLHDFIDLQLFLQILLILLNFPSLLLLQELTVLNYNL